MRLRKSGGNSKVKPKYHCGNFAKVLGKGSRQKPSIWCNICGWVHFTCSGLKRSCNNPAAFAGRNALKKTSNCSYRHVDNYLNRSET